MSANKHLLSVPIFWVVTLTPIIVASVIGIYMGYKEGLVFVSWTKENLEFTVAFFKIPILIASLVFPLAAVVVANHRSVQSVAMMQLQNSQNNFANYWLHLDKFTSQIDEKSFLQKFSSIRVVHDAFYPNAEQGDLSIDSHFIEGLDTQLKQLDATEKIIFEMQPIAINFTDITPNQNLKDKPTKEDKDRGKLIKDENYQQLVLGFTAELLTLLNEVKKKTKNRRDFSPNITSMIGSLLDYITLFEKIIVFAGLDPIDFKTDCLEAMTGLRDSNGWVITSLDIEIQNHNKKPQMANSN